MSEARSRASPTAICSRCSSSTVWEWSSGRWRPSAGWRRGRHDRDPRRAGSEGRRAVPALALDGLRGGAGRPAERRARRARSRRRRPRSCVVGSLPVRGRTADLHRPRRGEDRADGGDRRRARAGSGQGAARVPGRRGAPTRCDNAHSLRTGACPRLLREGRVYRLRRAVRRRHGNFTRAHAEERLNIPGPWLVCPAMTILHRCLLACAVLLLVGSARASSAKEEGFSDLTIDQVSDLIAKKEADIFDNNSKEDYAKGHLPTARWVSFKDVKESDLPTDKSRKLVFYCANTH